MTSKTVNIDAELRELCEIGRCVSVSLEEQIREIVERIEAAIRPVETTGFFTVEKCGHPLTCKCNTEEPSPERRCVCGLAAIPEGELRVEVGPTTHRLAGPCFPTSSVNGT